MSGEIEKRILSKVNIDKKTGCWEWKGAIRENGYTRTTYKRKNWYIHRLAWFLFNGEIPNGYDVCHKCDNRKCCNPDHLFIGTRKDNMQDAKIKNRVATGFRLPQTKLSNEDKKEVLKKINSGEKYKTIANIYKVSSSLIKHIAKKEGVKRYVISK